LYHRLAVNLLTEHGFTSVNSTVILGLRVWWRLEFSPVGAGRGSIAGALAGAAVVARLVGWATIVLERLLAAGMAGVAIVRAHLTRALAAAKVGLAEEWTSGRWPVVAQNQVPEQLRAAVALQAKARAARLARTGQLAARLVLDLPLAAAKLGHRRLGLAEPRAGRHQVWELAMAVRFGLELVHQLLQLVPVMVAGQLGPA
jgi:hypothetical protein